MEGMGDSAAIVTTALLLLMAVCPGRPQQLTFSVRGTELTNFVVHGDSIVVAEENKLVKLHKSNLSPVEETSTCVPAVTGSDCDNMNQVLAVHPLTGDLAVCGTGNNGICQFRSVANISHVQAQSQYDVGTENKRNPYYRTVSKFSSRPAVTVFDTSNPIIKLYSGITYSPELVNTSGANAAQPKKVFQLIAGSTSEFEQKKYIRLDLNNDAVNPNSFLIFFKAGFESGDFIYFLTNQRNLVGDDGPYVSKLVRICKNDPPGYDPGADIPSYTDIVLSCTHGGETYNLVQDATLLEPGTQLRESLGLSPEEKVVVATFTKGDNPEAPSGPSVICVFPLEDMDQHVMEAKRKYVLCPDLTVMEKGEPVCLSTAGVQPHQRYLKQIDGFGLEQRRNESDVDSESLNNFLRCAESSASLGWYYIIGEVTLTKTAVYTDMESTFTTVRGMVPEETRYTAVHVGDSKGVLKKLNVNSGSAAAVLYGSVPVEAGYQNPVRAMYLDQDAEYVLTSRKLVKFPSTSCSQFTTCAETMEDRDPLCGWCVYDNKSTRKTDSACSRSNATNHWLSALTECVSLTLQPNAIPIQSTRKVTVTTGKLPVSETGDTYQCQFVDSAGASLSRVPATRQPGTDTFQCQAPSRNDHTSGSVQLHVVSGGTDILLASANFLFYDCGTYTGCSACLPVGVECHWCLQTTRCISSGQSCDSGSSANATSQCPRLEDNSDSLFIHANRETAVTLTGSSLPQGVQYKCRLDGTEVPAIVAGDTIQCSVKYDWPDDEISQKAVPFQVVYGSSTLDDSYGTHVTAYKCGKLGPDCSTCRAVESHFKCDWCGAANDDACQYSGTGAVCSSVANCPPPTITRVLPSTAPVKGEQTKVAISGTELGSRVEDVAVTLAGIPCRIDTTELEKEFVVSKKVVCIAGKSTVEKSGPVNVTVKGQQTSNKEFKYQSPSITAISPHKGIASGGTRATLYGEILDIGNKIIVVQIRGTNNLRGECDNPVVEMVTDSRGTSGYGVTCDMPKAVEGTTLTQVRFTVDGSDFFSTPEGQLNYTYTTDPAIDGVSPMKTIAMGGTEWIINGQGFLNVKTATVESISKEKKIKVMPCVPKSDTQIACPFPTIPPAEATMLKQMYENKSQGRRRKRQSDSCDCIRVEVVLKLDGIERSYFIEYYPNPTIDSFENEVLLYKTDQAKLVIKGSLLTLAATEKDFNVTIGTEVCSVVRLAESQLECIPSSSQRQSAPETKYAVNVTVGNLKVQVGFLKFEEEVEALKKALIIGGAVVGVVLAIVIIVIVLIVIKCKRVGKKAQKFQNHLKQIEIEIKEVARTEFADMQTIMAVVNTDLVERGFPYHKYHEFAFKVLFPSDIMDNHPLLQEPVVSKRKVSDGARARLTTAMNMFEDLISNKFFLMSVISTMERQRKFFLKDKSNMAGYLSTILLGKMDYFNEILMALLTNLVQESISKKTQKTLFRRCESITEKLLSNWLSLCLYPHIKAHSGSPLYLLYKATQMNMESGPIDAVTGDAKYTLSEEKLLKKYSQQAVEGSNEPTFEAKVLVLNIQVNNSEECFQCRALDCDTISQVKQKCLSQIYVNYPASELAIHPADLELEWRAGMGGCLKLQDQDTTSKRDGGWVRLNTLAHYNVKDDSNMVLVDPATADADGNEQYVNLAQIHLDNMNCNGSMDSTDHLISPHHDHDTELRPWHIVKPEDDNPTKSLQRTAIAELYLNRLFSTKQSILKYIEVLFDSVLNDDEVPPPVWFLYNFLDSLAENNKVEADILHAWKSHSYPVRIWAGFIAKPSKLFDVETPVYLDTSLDVISQAFIDSFSLTGQKLSKDSPSHKLLFSHEMQKYRDTVKAFYKNIKLETQDPVSLRRFLSTLNKTQMQETRFNKLSALHQFYQQLEPYRTEIIQDLEDSETSSLQLEKKLEEVIMMMGDED